MTSIRPLHQKLIDAEAAQKRALLGSDDDYADASREVDLAYEAWTEEAGDEQLCYDCEEFVEDGGAYCYLHRLL